MMESIKKMAAGNDDSIEKLRALDDVVLFTTTMYGADKHSLVRQELALKLLDNASRLGMRVVVVDGGSNTEFLEKARQCKGVMFVSETPNKTMGAGRRQALDEAMKLQNASVFFWTEPERDTLVNSVSLGDMVQKVKSGEADIVMARRRGNDMRPEFQRWIETRANKKAAPLMRAADSEKDDEIDFWFAPKMFNRDAARYFSEYTGKLDKWDAVIKPVIQAAQEGKKIASVDVDYTYDRTQVDAEEGDRTMNAKRFDQYRQILAELGDDFWSREGKGVKDGEPKSTKLKET